MTAAHSSVVFLMYHELALPGRKLVQSEPGYVRYVLKASEFAAHMSAIADLGFRGVNVSQALQFPSNAVAVTFDDGCETDLLCAAPLLKQHGFGATFYVVAEWIGKPGFLSINQLRELLQQGFEVGCHSMTHAYLSDLDDAGLEREIVRAKIILEEMLAARVEHFSCPGGRNDARVQEFAKRAGFRTVATSVPQVNTPATDRFSLGRVAMKRGLGLQSFRRISQGRALWTTELGGGLRDRAKRLLGNRAYDRVRSLILGK
jgi:peptidoglycan/xylan/chitin deacetylase (PgdA/CDA1 family)